MNRQAASPGWYCDVTLSGASVVLVPYSHVVFNGAVVPLPYGQNVLMVRIAPNGQKFVGIGHKDDRAWEWDGHQWTPHGLAFGPRSVLYDNDNRLLTISGPDTPAGSQGMRYIDDAGTVVYSHETYADPGRGIWEYTERGTETIGQGGSSHHGEDACIGIVEGVRRVIEGGTCRFINVYREGDQFFLAYVREDWDAAVRCTFSLDELRAMPEYNPVVDLPPIVIDPPPVDRPPIVIDPPPVVIPLPSSVLKGRIVR